jgi:glucokinase
MATSDYPRLLGDVGGTNVRFALQEAPGGSPQRVRRYPTAAHGSFADAARRYLADEGLAAVSQAAIGIANPVTGDEVRMTNHAWSFSIEATRVALGLQRFVVVNDFQALALALPALGPGELIQVGGGQPVQGEPLGLIGPGTGLGVSGLVWTPDGSTEVALDGEGGHVTLCAMDDDEDRVIRALRQRYGHVSAERALCGEGLENLHLAITGENLADADITSRAIAGDSACERTLGMFCGMLGSVAGNLALTLGARGGVYIGGGIVPRLGGWFATSPFRARFEAKGRMTAYLKPIPTYVITADVSPALIGAARALAQGEPAKRVTRPRRPSRG